MSHLSRFFESSSQNIFSTSSLHLQLLTADHRDNPSTRNPQFRLLSQFVCGPTASERAVSSSLLLSFSHDFPLILAPPQSPLPALPPLHCSSLNSSVPQASICVQVSLLWVSSMQADSRLGHQGLWGELISSQGCSCTNSTLITLRWRLLAQISL